jgi:hypothetical protein
MSQEVRQIDKLKACMWLNKIFNLPNFYYTIIKNNKNNISYLN